jgi:hypothetical protein
MKTRSAGLPTVMRYGASSWPPVVCGYCGSVYKETVAQHGHYVAVSEVKRLQIRYSGYMYVTMMYLFGCNGHVTAVTVCQRQRLNSVRMFIIPVFMSVL